MSEAALAPAADTTPAYVPNTGPAYRRLTIADIGLVLQFHDEGKTQAEIAQRLNVTQPTISQVLSQMGTDSCAIAARLAKGRAYQSVRRTIRMAEKSEDEPTALKAARTVLEVAGVLHTGQSLSVGVQVVLGQPSSQPQQQQAITVQLQPSPTVDPSNP